MTPRLRTPCVDIEADRIKLGVRYQWGEVQSILNVGVAPVVEDDTLRLKLLAFRAGSLPLPRTLVARRITIDPLPHPDEGSEILLNVQALFEQLFTGKDELNVPNEFTWPNGEIRFQIAGIVMEDKCITLRIEPLHGV